MRIDEFFEKQPSTDGVISALNAPLWAEPIEGFGKRLADGEEVSCHGMYISDTEEEWDEVLATAYADITDFLSVHGIGGRVYPLRILRASGLSEGSFTVSVTASDATVYASDPEGARRAVYYLEEEMVKREGAFLPPGDITRIQRIRRRITRGFFSPTNRAPKWGDELLDGVDYYPDNYLARLARNGTDGLWIYTSFAQLVRSPYMPEVGRDQERRMEKLRSVVKKCARYGIRVYLFAIEPMGLTEEQMRLHPDLLGAEVPKSTLYHPLCPRIEGTREHVIYCLEHIYSSIPELAGYISITAGERPTTCVSVGSYKTCPRCRKYSRGENLAHSVDMIMEGLRRAGTGAEFISWTYGHRYWDDRDIAEYIEKIPDDIIVMQNFEDRGLDIQLGKPRVAWDYWLSYPGPSGLFSDSAELARKEGKRVYAKMQVCSSHEMATVPFIPAPGILFDKYKAARELSAEGIMECWYFGNYPSLMNRASTELSYIENFDDKDGFLYELAARLYGESRAERIAAAWREFEAAYRNYPTNIMTSYYGPFHDGVVWELFPIPVNRPLPRSWLLLDAPDGDRIGESLFRGHTLSEEIALAEEMCRHWQKGLELLPLSPNDGQVLCAEAIGLLTRSAGNILRFYDLRERLGEGRGEVGELLSEMEGIVLREIENSERMAELCERDPCLGYHSEAEGFKFFPEKLKARVKKLKALFAGDFAAVKERVAKGLPPLGYYYAEGEEYYPLTAAPEAAEWVELDAERAFSAYLIPAAEDCGASLAVRIRARREDRFRICLELSLFHPESMIVYSPVGGGASHVEVAGATSKGLSLGGNVLSHQSVLGEDMISEALSPYALNTVERDGGYVEHTLVRAVPEHSPLYSFGAACGAEYPAIKMSLTVGGVSWQKPDDPVRTLGKSDISPDDFGFLLPIK